ncbi:oxidation resistance protein [Vairimorpha necatrix]|uniref:Oxidation resistance protein 1 n=1 Tax=Vairimorpha necatrix TaxID=6039 RepID=A0AAX4JAP0_9MICR
MDLPELDKIPINLVLNTIPYKNSFLNKKIINKIRELIDLRYKYSRNWNLMFSTYEHGFSYKSLISSFLGKKKPFILLIKTNNTVIGIYFEEHLELALNPYGARKVKLFNEHEVISLKLNEVKIICNEEFLAFGCSEGVYSIFIKKTIREGEQNVFVKNDKKFKINYLEIWNIIE